jgi:LmbE family N-acetylglucosaminyl deacetylase
MRTGITGIVALAAVLGAVRHATPPITQTSRGSANTTSKRTTAKTYLLVVAHPDDEAMVGPMLAKLARQGHRVHVLIATDGKYGTRISKIPEGDLLGAVRRKESECACERLGVKPPIFLSVDRLDTKNGVRSYVNGRKTLLLKLKQELTALKPDAVFTFGPDGEQLGHPEHIVVGSAITELLLRDGLVDRYPLYYLAWLKSMVQDDEGLSYVDPRYVDLRVTYTDEDERRAIEANKCYVSQHTPEEMAERARGMLTDRSNSIPFRRLHVRRGGGTRALDDC